MQESSDPSFDESSRDRYDDDDANVNIEAIDGTLPGGRPWLRSWRFNQLPLCQQQQWPEFDTASGRAETTNLLHNLLEQIKHKQGAGLRGLREGLRRGKAHGDDSSWAGGIDKGYEKEDQGSTNIVEEYEMEGGSLLNDVIMGHEFMFESIAIVCVHLYRLQ